MTSIRIELKVQHESERDEQNPRLTIYFYENNEKTGKSTHEIQLTRMRILLRKKAKKETSTLDLFPT